MFWGLQGEYLSMGNGLSPKWGAWSDRKEVGPKITSQCDRAKREGSPSAADLSSRGDQDRLVLCSLPWDRGFGRGRLPHLAQEPAKQIAAQRGSTRYAYQALREAGA